MILQLAVLYFKIKHLNFIFGSKMCIVKAQISFSMCIFVTSFYFAILLIEGECHLRMIQCYDDPKEFDKFY